MKKAVVGTFVSLFLANPSFAQGIIKCQTEEVIESTQVLAIELLGKLGGRESHSFCLIHVDREHRIPNQNTNLTAIGTCNSDILSADGRKNDILESTLPGNLPPAQAIFIYDPTVGLIGQTSCHGSEHIKAIPLKKEGITIPLHIDPRTVG